MRLTPDRAALVVNSSLTLAGIPPQCFSYRLGNRSALEWVIDQYQVSEDKRSGIVSDPNNLDDEEYIVRLVRQVVTVSEEAQLITAMVAQRYLLRLVPGHPVEPEVSLTLRPRYGLPMTLQPR